MKALGFSDGTCGMLLIAESLLLSLGGGALGCAFAYGSVPMLRKLFGTQIPKYDIHDETTMLAVAVALVVGLLAGLIPSLRARRLDAAQALREEI